MISLDGFLRGGLAGCGMEGFFLHLFEIFADFYLPLW